MTLRSIWIFWRMVTRAVYLEAERVARENLRLANEQTARELRRNATPQTIRHRRENVLEEQLWRGKITSEQFRAAGEIEKLYQLLTAGVGARIAKYDRAAVGGDFADWQGWAINAYHQRYIPWRDEAGRQALKTGTVADLALGMAAHNLGTNQLAKVWKISPRRVLELVRTSLHRYAEIGGWVDACGRPADAGLGGDYAV